MNKNNMKWTFAITLLSGLFLGSVYIASQEPSFRCDRCSASFALLKGGYRAWGLDYCYGFQPQSDGSEKHFYHAPKFYHSDVRKLLFSESEQTGTNLWKKIK